MLIRATRKYNETMKLPLLVLLLAASLTDVKCQRALFESRIVSTLVTNLVKVFMNAFPPMIATTPKVQILDEYDFIIVGSGPAGSVVANRLSEVSGWKVLLLEAGKSESWISSVPFFAPLMQWTDYNWDYRMEYQADMCRAMDNGRCLWPRGKALGGTSVINYMIYTRGNKEDFNRMERNGNTGWGYDTILEYYKKSEKEQLDDAIIDKPYHGETGYLRTENVFRSEATDALVHAGNGDNVAKDYNGVDQIVFSRVQGTVNKGKRDSAAKSYLLPAMNRPNLHILTEALVTKVNFDDNNVAQGVDYIYKGITYTVKARKEVIVSAGTFKSPQLLMLSGIGPKAQLENFNISVKVDQPWVGKNMQDHLAFVGSTLIFDKKYENFFSFLNPINWIRWLLFGTGPLTSLGGVTALGYMKTDIADYPEDIPDIEFILATMGGFMSDYGWLNRKSFGISDAFYNSAMSEDDPGAALVIPMLVQPKSKGFLELRSADPKDPVKLYGNFWSDPRDKKAFIASVRRVIELANTEPLKSMGARFSSKRIPECLQFGDLTDEYISCALEFLSVTLHHQTGTCKMGPSNDVEAVVGPDLKVYNVERLRVIDCSIIPEAIAAHTNAPSFVIGEKGADLIKQDHGIPI